MQKWGGKGKGERKKEIVQEGDTAVQFSELFFKNVQIHFKIEESSKYSESGQAYQWYKRTNEIEDG